MLGLAWAENGKCRWQQAAARREREDAKAEVAAKAVQQEELTAARKAQAAAKASAEAALAEADAIEYQAALAQAAQERQKHIKEARPGTFLA